MQISTKSGLAFLSMPKCASTSIEAAISKHCNINCTGHGFLKHVNVQNFIDYILPLTQTNRHYFQAPKIQLESFCLMRDPLDWIESWYRYKSRDAIIGHANYTGNITYQTFIEEFLSKDERKPYTRLESQLEFLSLNNGEIGVDTVMPMSHMDLVADYLSKKLGVKIELESKNISPTRNNHLDLELKKQLESHFAKDIALYQFIEENGSFIKARDAKKVSAILASA